MMFLRFAFVLLFAGGCSSSNELLLCGQIPDGGCPIGRGGTCDDHACVGLYDCVQGSWTLVEGCEGGSGGAGGSDAGGAGGCEPVMIDKTGEATGCKPDLQSPDCPLVAAETCLASACLTDCGDFFLCTKDGWIDVAYCDIDGKLVIPGGSEPAPSDS
jgi:hypothetical protein